MKKVWIHKAKSFKDAEEWDRKFWRQAGVQARFSAARDLVRDYLKMKGKDASLLRLRRSVQHIRYSYGQKKASRPQDKMDIEKMESR